MIKIGIVGLGNVAWNVHLPVLLSDKILKLIGFVIKFESK